MAPAVVGSILGAATLTAGRGAVIALGNGLSFGAELLRGANGNPQVDCGDGERPAIGLPAELKQRINDLTAQIRRHLTSAGIKLTKPLELTSNGAGGIAIAGDDPLHAAIQEALGNDILLETEFDHLASDYAEFVAGGKSELPSTLHVVVPTK